VYCDAARNNRLLPTAILQFSNLRFRLLIFLQSPNVRLSLARKPLSSECKVNGRLTSPMIVDHSQTLARHSDVLASAYNSP
jgi:hypothetical protein